MSVTTYGVKGYKYQYRLTVLIALLFNRSQDEKLFAEMVGSEDITLIDSNGEVLEIQSKMERNDLDLQLFSKWLLHFQERDSRNNLLNRVIDKKCRCLFITRSRCNDDTRIFLNDFADISVKDTVPNRKFLKSLREAIFQTTFTATPLNISREKSSKDIAQKITDGELKHLINHARIWEQIEEERIDDQVLFILNKKYSVPESQTETLYLKLLKIVEDGKDTKDDIMPLLRSAIAKVQVNKFTLNQFYISRSHEQDAKRKLERNHSLLLTGVSQCGKTELAKKIANEYVDKGYNKIRSTSELLAVENFFNQNPSESKIAIIEDPFGHIKPKEDTTEIKKRLIDICNGLPANHKLIITSRKEILDEAFSSSVLKEFTSVNITENSTNEILHFWDEFSREYHVNEKVKTDLQKYISNENENKLQIGQLEYLAKYDKDTLLEKSISELITIARHNSADIASDLHREDRDRANVLGLLSVCCSNIIAVNSIELKYVFSKDKLGYTVFKGNKIIQLIKKESKYPQYSTENKIPQKVKSYFAYFEERGFIRKDGKNIVFSHPNYFEAARILFIKKNNNEQKKNLKYLKKALACISPVTAKFACKELFLIYKKIDETLKGKVRELMLFANQSIYPSVEDIASINLSFILDDFSNSDEKDNVVRIIGSGNTDSGALQWYNDEIPYIGKGTFGGFDLPDKSIVDKVENRLAENKYVTVHEAWDYVNYYQWHSFTRENFKVKPEIIVSLLTYDEVFIRKQAAKIFFSAKIEHSERFLIDKILDDTHPTVVFYGIWGAFLYWIKQNAEVKAQIFSIIKALLLRKEIAIRCSDLISTFSVDYSGECIDWESYSEEEKIELWNVWGEIFPIFSKTLPASVYFNVGRFGNTMTTASKYLTYDNGIKVFFAWYERIEYKIDQRVAVSDYEMGIIEDLIDFTKDDYTARIDLFKKVFSNKDSGFLLYSLKNIFRYYDKLHIEEKRVIVNLIESNRSDIKWIHALLLTLQDVPKPLILIITNGKDIFRNKPKEILEILPTELVYKSLMIVYGKPQQLEYLQSYERTKFWNRIINYILFYQIEPYFRLCVEEFIGPNIWGKRTENFRLWKIMCLKTKNLDYLLYLVLYNISISNINVKETREVFFAIKYVYETKGRIGDFTRIVADNIEAIQLTHKEDIFKYFDDDYIFNQLLPKIYPDNLAKKIIESVGATGLPELVENIESFSFFYTYLVINKIVEESESLDTQTKSKILGLQNTIGEVGEKKQKDIKKKYLLPYPKIENWN